MERVEGRGTEVDERREDRDGLNPAQRAAVEYGLGEGQESPGPLLVIAGAGTGKTNTLAHRVARLIETGVDPRRILLLTFTRRAAQEMTRRVERIVATRRTPGAAPARLAWAGTFHSMANRLLRLHSSQIGLDPSFTVLDSSDAADLMDLERHRLGLSERSRRFPRKSTCLAIYSHSVNAGCPLKATLETAFPWCDRWNAQLRSLFGAYVEAKQRANVLDYDDLLLYWSHLMGEPALAQQVSRRFDHVLVDEYQDTNALQASILMRLCPGGRGLTVVGDEAQAIYAFRAASVKNILDFPSLFEPPARIVTLEENYRSTQPILDASNAVIALSSERYEKTLFSRRPSEAKPHLVMVEDEAEQARYVVERILEDREGGLALKRQAVLFRTSHHSAELELELSRRDIPFVKFGGLRFLEAAHVKDLLCVLRWAENPRDAVAAFRLLQILPGIGPVHARRLLEGLAREHFAPEAMSRTPVPPAARADWEALGELYGLLRDEATPWPGQTERARRWYEPHLNRLHDDAMVRMGDLIHLEEMADAHPTRERFLSELTLDPPAATGAEAGPPHLDEDYLILSTIHSAKGQEWDVVHLLNLVDGCIPSDMACNRPEEIEEERRLLYVAMTRARDHLHLLHPMRFYVHHQPRNGDRHVYAPRSRFVPDALLELFEREVRAPEGPGDALHAEGSARIDVASRLRGMWD
jgi:DNA helicase-2/ATP-dependent DNA helicase PcrA